MWAKASAIPKIFRGNGAFRAGRQKRKSDPGKQAFSQCGNKVRHSSLIGARSPVLLFHADHRIGICNIFQPRLELAVFPLIFQYFGMGIHHFLLQLHDLTLFFRELTAPGQIPQYYRQTDDQQEDVNIQGDIEVGHN